MNIGDVIQFNEKHKWCGSLGIITEKKIVATDDPNIKDVRYMVGVPCPMQGTAYIFVMGNENSIEYIGRAVMMVKEVNDDEE